MAAAEWRGDRHRTQREARLGSDQRHVHPAGPEVVECEDGFESGDATADDDDAEGAAQVVWVMD